MTTLKAQLASAGVRIRRKLQARQARPEAGGEQPRGSVALSPAEAQVARSAQQALAGWRASAEGQAFFAGLAGKDLATIQAELGAVLAGPVFAPTMQLAISLGDLIPVQSISLGLAAQADLGLGLYGSIGYAADIIDPLKNSVLYAFGAVSEGIDAGADIAGQIGLWRGKVSDLPGYYWGVEMEVDDGGGIAGFGLSTNEEATELAAVMVEVTGGVNDGADGLEFYALTFGIQHGPVAQQPADHLLILTNLHCGNINSVEGHDEVNLTFSADGGETYRYPTWNYYAMSDDQNAAESNWAVGRSVWFNNSVSVSLWDGNDSLGNFTFSHSDFAGIGASVQKYYQRDGSISNGWNEIAYDLTAKLVK